MLVIESRGAGIFDVISKVANSALASKVINSTLANKAINSTIGKQVIKHATKENFKKAAESAIGKQLKTAFVNKVADASEKIAANTLQKLGIESKPGVIAKTAKKVTNSALQNTGLWEEPKRVTEKSALQKIGIKRKRKSNEDIAGAAFTRLGISRKRQRQLSRLPGRKRRKGAGIILE